MVARNPDGGKTAGKTAQVLSIAGFDPSGGAGLLADSRVFSAHGLYGTGVVTAITIQDTSRVLEVQAVGVRLLEEQLRVLTGDIQPVASKTGMLASGEAATVIAEFARRRLLGRLVVDPVLASTSGASLADERLVDVLKRELLPACKVVTPNIHEAEALTGVSIEATGDAVRAGTALLELGASSACITGGHFPGEAVDVFVDVDGAMLLEAPRFNGELRFHGTGCCFSAAVTACLALGHTPKEAVRQAKEATAAAIADAVKPGKGMPVPWYRSSFESEGRRG